MEQHITERGLRLIESFEGYSGTRYFDSVGVATIGYGTTAAVIGSVPATCTRLQAEGWLRLGLERDYEPAIRALGVPLNPNQFDALCSFVYNLGPGSMEWDVGRLLRARDYTGAANAMLQYDHAGGMVLAGLTRRREAERALFLTPWSAPKSYHYERYAKGFERTAVERFDHWRERQTSKHHPHRAWLLVRKAQCGLCARRIELAVTLEKRRPKKFGDPWKRKDRLFRHPRLVTRSKGGRVSPA